MRKFLFTAVVALAILSSFALTSAQANNRYGYGYYPGNYNPYSYGIYPASYYSYGYYPSYYQPYGYGYYSGNYQPYSYGYYGGYSWPRTWPYSVTNPYWNSHRNYTYPYGYYRPW